MSLQTGRTLGLISSVIFVILPIIALAAVASLFAVIVSMIPAVGTGTVPDIGTIAGFSAGLIGVIAILGVLGLVGIVLLLISMYNLSQYYQESGIFKNLLYAVIINIVSVVVSVLLQFAYLIPASVTITPGTTTNPSDVFGGFFIVFIAILIVSVALTIVSAVLVMRAFNKLGEKSEVDSFKTTGLLYLIGVLLTFVVIGVFIIWIAYIFAAISFYRLKPAAPVTYTTPSPSISLETKRCPYCSTENKLDATYCRFCGKPLQ